MIAKVEIENYQSHKKTVIEFIPGTNVIIGESDAGKSAVFRAINWVCSNRPLGDAFRSEWGGNTRVALYTSEGDVIERIRSANDNEYILNGTSLKAFGTEVPEEIIQILKMDTANIQSQIDPPFLLAATPGEAARLLNKAASIDDIDHTIAALQKSHFHFKGEIEQDTNQLIEYRQQMELYKDIPILEKKLSQVEDFKKQSDKKTDEVNKITRLMLRANEIKLRLKKTEHIPELLRKYEEAADIRITYQIKEAEQQRIIKTTRRAKRVKKDIAATEGIDKALSILKKKEVFFTKWKEKNKGAVSLKSLIKRKYEVENSIKTIREKIKEMEQEFREIAPEVCPLCGNMLAENP